MPEFVTKTLEWELARNARRVARLDIPGGGQVVVQDGYAYVGHMKPPHGTSIIDVRDPANPKVVAMLRRRTHSPTPTRCG
jgi:hypothetical protein